VAPVCDLDGSASLGDLEWFGGQLGSLYTSVVSNCSWQLDVRGEGN